MGNLFWGTPGQFEQLGPRVADVYIGGAGTAGDLDTPAAQDYATNIIGKWFTEFKPGGDAAAAGVVDVHVRLLHQHVGPHRGPRGGRRATSPTRASSRRRWRRSELPAPYGDDQARRQPPGGADRVRPAALHETAASSAVKTVKAIPDVDQTFGGTFGPDTPRSGPRRSGLRGPRPAVDRQGRDRQGRPSARGLT